MRHGLWASWLLLGLSWALAQRIIPLNYPGSETERAFLSGNGQVVVTTYNRGGVHYPIVWRSETGWQFLRADGGLTHDYREALSGGAMNISFDGSVVVGTGQQGPFRWRLGRGLEYLPLPPGARLVGMLDVAADGQVVAGQLFIPEGGRARSAIVRWHTDGQIELIPELRGTNLTALSADGRAIVGDDTERFYFGQPFRWIEGRGVEYLPGFSGGTALAVSADGRVVAGEGTAASLSRQGAWRWVEGEGLEWLFPAGISVSAVTVMSWDGTILGGFYFPPGAYSSLFRWREGVGVEDLNEVYGWLLRGRWQSLHDISSDGRYWLGSGGGYGLFLLDTVPEVSSVWVLVGGLGLFGGWRWGGRRRQGQG